MARTTEVKVPDIGDFKDVPVIEIHVAEGDAVNAEDPLITLESDKATMEVPAPAGGKVGRLLVKLGDTVNEGSPIVLLEAGDGALTQPPSLLTQQEPAPAAAPAPGLREAPAVPFTAPDGGAMRAPVHAAAAQAPDLDAVHAGPSVRRVAREFGVDLAKIKGSGEKGRITKDDVLAVVRGPAAAAAPAAGAGIPEIPTQDFSKFGAIETRPLPRIKKISGPHLHRAWLNVPHVTHGDEADITEIEAYRKELDAAGKEDKRQPYRVSLLPFLMKASVSALKTLPDFNSSLSPEKDALILKEYYNIGIAVDTPDGLVVPVIKEVDRKGILELSRELGAVSAKARDGKLAPGDMAGGCFTISSLGGIGGTDFTPIVNAPEVAILGVVRSHMAPVWDGEQFVPRLMLPLYLSYDHRVTDGAAAARFCRHLCQVLEDVRRLAL